MYELASMNLKEPAQKNQEDIWSLTKILSLLHMKKMKQ